MTASNDRLDRIEALLEASMAQHSREMEEIRAGLRETKAITESNARAIGAWSGRIADAEADSRTMAAAGDQRLETAIADTVAMIADMGRQQQETDQRFEIFLQEARADRQRNAAEREETDQRFEVFLQEARADRQRFDNTMAEQQEAAQRFEVFLQESRTDRQRFDQAMAANAAEHRAFTQNVQVLLAEISRLWQRVAG